MTKICTQCEEIKSLNSYNKRVAKKDGLRSECRSCQQIYRKKHYKNNIHKEIQCAKKYYNDNYKDNKEYRKNKNEYDRKYSKKRNKHDIQYKLTRNLRRRLRNALQGNYKSGSAVRDLGCTINELKVYLEQQFQPDMTWDNHGLKGWHIDHIRPLACFDLTDRKQLLEACHYTNLQPLWWHENLKKSDKRIRINELQSKEE